MATAVTLCEDKVLNGLLAFKSTGEYRQVRSKFGWSTTAIVSSVPRPLFPFIDGNADSFQVESC